MLFFIFSGLIGRSWALVSKIYLFFIHLVYIVLIVLICFGITEMVVVPKKSIHRINLDNENVKVSGPRAKHQGFAGCAEMCRFLDRVPFFLDFIGAERFCVGWSSVAANNFSKPVRHDARKK